MVLLGGDDCLEEGLKFRVLLRELGNDLFLHGHLGPVDERSDKLDL